MAPKPLEHGTTQSRLFAFLTAVAVFAATVAPAAMAVASVTRAPKANFPQMYGGWYIVATIPSAFKKRPGRPL